MTLCHVSAANISLSASQEFIITWGKEEDNKHHTKPEYLKILKNGDYAINYIITWESLNQTTQPLQVTIYKVSKEFTMLPIQQNVTVCTGKPVTLKKKFPFDLAAGERICIGAKNFSAVDFILIRCQLSLTQI